MLGTEYYAWRIAASAVPSLPESLDETLSVALGSAFYAARPRARDNVRANLEVIVPGIHPREREALVRRTFVNQARNYIRTFRLPLLSAADILRQVTVSGWEHVAAAGAGGRGIVFATAHLGPLVLVGQVVSARGVAVSVIAEPIAPRMFALLNERLRGAFGVTFVSSRSAVTIYRVLRRGGAVGILADRAVTGVGERVPFFGRPALLPAGHVLLAQRTGAPLLPGFALRELQRFHAEILPPLELVPGRTREALRENVSRWASVLERYVKRAPDEWAVFDRVWDPGR
jgi:lauroyl/myristoyl acyltransferase